MAEIGLHALSLCTVQGRLFEMAWSRGYDMKEFISGFMTSVTAASLDESFNRLQFCGEEYLFEEFITESDIKRTSRRRSARHDAFFWIGYLYRYWHFYTGETSVKMFRIADYDLMTLVYAGYHTLSCEMAIDWLRERRRKTAA